MRALVAEQEERVSRFITRVLSEDGFLVDGCSRGRDALVRMSLGDYDVALIDRATSNPDGIEVCRHARASGVVVPILMLSAIDSVGDRVLALDAGADDYIIKPFDPVEMLARVRALLRRSTRPMQRRLGPLEIDSIDGRILVAGRALDLTTREYALLMELAHHRDRIVTRTELLTQVWSIDFDPESNVIEAQIRRLRRKLGEHAWMIETVRGRGYRFRSSR